MTSVRKLVLVPIDVWDKARKAVPHLGSDDLKEVSVPVGHQVGSGPGEKEGERVVETTLSPPPTPAPPPPSPTTGDEGEGKGEEGPPAQPTGYVDRKETGKDQTPQEIRRDAGIWRPPGFPAPLRRSTLPWIHL